MRIAIGLTLLASVRGSAAAQPAPATQPSDAGYIDVLQLPVETSRRFFDKRWPPKGLSLGEGFVAHTDTYFDLSSFVYGPVVKEGIDDDGWHYADVRVTGFTITLGLYNTISFNQEATPTTMRHEDGHRRIGDRFYDRADLIVIDVARPMIGTVVRGLGRTEKSARSAAYGSAGSKLVRAWHARIDPMVDRVHEIFDRLTDHAANYEPHEAEALRQAFDEFDREGGWTRGWAEAQAARAATQPATTEPTTQPSTPSSTRPSNEP